MIRVLQIGGDREFRREVEDYCSRIHDLHYQEKTSEKTPDVILLDTDAQSQGGFAVLEEIRTRWRSQQVKVILFSKAPPGDERLQKAVDLGADYFILHPVDLVVMERRIRQVTSQQIHSPYRHLTMGQVQAICTVSFERMGIPPHYKGYRYLMKGIWLAALHPAWLNSVTRDLYPAIGQRFGVSGAQVERAMRYTIDVTWEKGNLDQLHELFPYVSEKKGKPTNSTFIAKMVDLVGIEASRDG